MTARHPAPTIAAVIAAAGRSTRMGEPKQLLPWGARTVLGTVAANLAEAGATPVLCVVGHRAAEMIAALADAPARVVENRDYLHGEMLSSYQAGIAALLDDNAPYHGTLLALGDQPHVPVRAIRLVLEAAHTDPSSIVVPSHAMRRGHPFYLPRRLWPDLIALGRDDTLRTLMRRHENAIRYIAVDTDAILRDIDTPQDYRDLAPPP
jgi:molybdenum cofactor cytidylyltransferase